MIRRILIATLMASMLAACNEQLPTSAKENTNTINALSEQEKKEGWQLLFDGRSTNGWHSYGKQHAGKAWKITDGILILDTLEKEGFQIKDGGDLVTNEEFENYHLTLEWKIAKGGNSGIIFNVKEDTAQFPYTWSSGPEMQVLDKDYDPDGDGKLDKHRAGDLYDLIAASRQVAKGAEQWNKAEIIMNRGKLQLFLNGENIINTTFGDDQWKQLIANSKFKDMPGFGSFQKGRIALQDHGHMLAFRNIKIKQL